MFLAPDGEEALKLFEKEEPDLIVFGKLSVDTENNQVAQRLAGLLEWPQATFAYEVEVADGWATVGREVDGGTTTLKFELPGIITADLRLNEPRYASLPGIMKARSKPLDTYTPDDLGVELQLCDLDQAQEAARGGPAVRVAQDQTGEPRELRVEIAVGRNVHESLAGNSIDEPGFAGSLARQKLARRARIRFLESPPQSQGLA